MSITVHDAIKSNDKLYAANGKSFIKIRRFQKFDLKIISDQEICVIGIRNTSYE